MQNTRRKHASPRDEADFEDQSFLKGPLNSPRKITRETVLEKQREHKTPETLQEAITSIINRPQIEDESSRLQKENINGQTTE